MERLNIEVVENATKTVNIMPETPLEKAVADCMTDYLKMRKAEEHGLIARLPCAIGSMVYAVTRDFISEYTICDIEVYKEGFFLNWKCEKGIYSNIRGFTNHDIGKTVFLTREEAEQALKQKGE